MSQETLEALTAKIKAHYKSKVTIWIPTAEASKDNIYIECKGFTGPSKKVEKIIADLGLTIKHQMWSGGSDYSGYYYWIA